MGHPPVSVNPTHPAISSRLLPDALPGGVIGRGEATSPHPLVNIGGFVGVEGGGGTEVKVRVSQMKDWEMLARAGLGVTNHLDWFLGSIWQILIGVDLGPEK